MKQLSEKYNLKADYTFTTYLCFALGHKIENLVEIGAKHNSPSMQLSSSMCSMLIQLVEKNLSPSVKTRGR